MTHARCSYSFTCFERAKIEKEENDKDGNHDQTSLTTVFTTIGP